jgi:hypothetical protein
MVSDCVASMHGWLCGSTHFSASRIHCVLFRWLCAIAASSTAASLVSPVGRENFALVVLSTGDSTAARNLSFAIYGGVTQGFGALYDAWVFSSIEDSGSSSSSSGSNIAVLAGGGLVSRNYTWQRVASFTSALPRAESASFQNGRKMMLHGGQSSGVRS